MCFGDLWYLEKQITAQLEWALEGGVTQYKACHESTRAAVVTLVQKPALVVAHAYNPCAMEGRESKIP